MKRENLEKNGGPERTDKSYKIVFSYNVEILITWSKGKSGFESQPNTKITNNSDADP